MLDLGCGSGRLFRPLIDGGATRVVGIDGSRALLARAEARIEADRELRRARQEGRLETAVGDVRRVSLGDRFSLIILAGVIAHLDGPEEALRAFSAAGRHLGEDGVLVVDLLGPGALPPHDLPLSVDWERAVGDRRAVRRSRIVRHEAPEGLRVEYSTLTDLGEADVATGIGMEIEKVERRVVHQRRGIHVPGAAGVGGMGELRGEEAHGHQRGRVLLADD